MISISGAGSPISVYPKLTPTFEFPVRPDPVVVSDLNVGIGAQGNNVLSLPVSDQLSSPGTPSLAGPDTGTPSGAQQAVDGIKQAVTSWWEATKAVFTNSVRGAVEGANVSAAGANVGASTASKASHLSTTTLLAGALVLVLILRK